MRWEGKSSFIIVVYLSLCQLGQRRFQKSSPMGQITFAEGHVRKPSISRKADVIDTRVSPQASTTSNATSGNLPRLLSRLRHCYNPTVGIEVSSSDSIAIRCLCTLTFGMLGPPLRAFLYARYEDCPLSTALCQREMSIFRLTFFHHHLKRVGWSGWS